MDLSSVVIFLLLLITCFFCIGACQRKGDKSSHIISRFKAPSGSRLLITDLGGLTIGGSLISKGVIGRPDALIDCGEYLIAGEFKNRKFNNNVRRYEYYQVLLYAGHAKAIYRKPVKLRLAYRDSIIEIEYSRNGYMALLKLNNELSQQLKVGRVARLFTTPPKPLHVRWPEAAKFTYKILR